MAKPFKFRWVNELAGAFILLVVALAVAGFVLAWRAQKWFQRTHILMIEFPLTEGALGVTEGTGVEIIGIRVGSIDEIRIDPTGNVRATARLQGDFFDRFVRSDSQVLVKKQYTIAGDAYIDIKPGSGPPLVKGQVLPAKKDTELIELVTSLVDRMQYTVVPAIEEITAAAAEIKAAAMEHRTFAESLHDPQGSLQRFLVKLNEFADTLNKGPGVVQKLLRDETLARDTHAAVTKIGESLDKVKASLEEFQGILADVKKATAQLPKVAKAVGGEAQDLEGTVLQVQDTLRETERLIVGIQKHWLIRGNIPPVETSGAISPAAVAAEEAR